MQMTSTPQGPSRRRGRFLWIALALLVVGIWLMLITVGGEDPSVILSDGIQVIYLGSSRGVQQPPGVNGSTLEAPTYLHPLRGSDSRLQRWWQDFRGSLPDWAASQLPVWEYHPDAYPGWATRHECELQLRVHGDFAGRQHQIFLVDENGWETRVDDYIQGDDGRFRHGAPQPSGWIRLASAFPRQTRTMRVRFRRWQSGASPAELRASFTDLALPNPFYEARTPAQVGTLPISKPFRDGTATLAGMRRDEVVGSGYGSLFIDLTLRRSALPMPGFIVRTFHITDTSGQLFEQSDVSLTYRDGHCLIRTDCGPWSDDRCWHLRFSLCRDEYSDAVEEREKFRFEKLPPPGDSAITVNREITKNGITLRIAELGPLRAGGAPFTVEGWIQGDPTNRLIIVQDARDDRGRTRRMTLEGENAFLVHSWSVDPSHGPTFAVDLPPDATSWDLTLVPETITTVEFAVQPPPVK